MRKIRLALFGLGTVGGGTYQILQMNRELIEKRTGITTLGMMPILNEGAAGDLAPADKK